MLNALKTIFLPWLVIAEERGGLRLMTLHANRMCDEAWKRGERIFKLQQENLKLRAELATLKNDANGKVARGPKGRFVSVKG